MAIQNTVQDPQQAAGTLVAFYVRIFSVSLNPWKQAAQITVGYWRSKAAHDAGVDPAFVVPYRFTAAGMTSNGTAVIGGPTYAQIIAALTIPAGTYAAPLPTCYSVLEPQLYAFLLTLADFAGATEIAD